MPLMTPDYRVLNSEIEKECNILRDIVRKQEQIIQAKDDQIKTLKEIRENLETQLELYKQIISNQAEFIDHVKQIASEEADPTNPDLQEE